MDLSTVTIDEMTDEIGRRVSGYLLIIEAPTKVGDDEADIGHWFGGGQSRAIGMAQRFVLVQVMRQMMKGAGQ